MNVTDLAQLLKTEGYPSDAYSLIGNAKEEAWTLERINDRSWRVFFTERGKVRSSQEFETEHSACEALLSRLRHLRNMY
jgi:hypothetical protein